jgi:hypothetical protein
VKKEDCPPRPVPFSFPHDHEPNPAEPGHQRFCLILC